MKVSHSEILPEIIIIEPDVYKDDRGYFFETFQSERYLKSGLPKIFVQDNTSV
jgi:dTDP-4-dehydrorhamnose 3,5-epimerase